MNILISILLGIAGIIALFFLVALFVKKEYYVIKEITINKPVAEVFGYAKLIRNQEQYSVWVMKDPNIKIDYSGADGTVGFISSWKSNDGGVGVGAQEIMAIKENEKIEIEVRFKKPFEGIIYGNTFLESIDAHKTLVKSTALGQSKYPMNIMNLFMNKLLGKDMLQNLVNMKNNIEKI